MFFCVLKIQLEYIFKYYETGIYALIIEMVMIMLKMNRMSKLLNSLALVAALTVSTAVYAMEQKDPKAEDSKITVTKQSLVVVNEERMEEARSITREKVLENLYGYSEDYFKTNHYMVSSGTSDKFFLRIDKVQYNRNIHYFNETFLNNPEHVPTLNNDILALLEKGIKPTTYFDNECAFDGVKEALGAAGITWDALVSKTHDAEEVMEENTPSKRRHCIIS